MSIVMVASPVKIILDTNILISGIGFGGKPKTVLQYILDKKIKGVTSPILLAEFEDVIMKKFSVLSHSFKRIDKQIRKRFKIVIPKNTITVLRDEDDNRVLEAAVEGKCDFIITGDKDLLALGKYKNIYIVTAEKFLLLYYENYKKIEKL